MGEKGEWGHSGRYLMVCKELEFFLPFHLTKLLSPLPLFCFSFQSFSVEPRDYFFLSASISRTKPTSARYYS